MADTVAKDVAHFGTLVKAIGIKPELNVERSLSRQASCCRSCVGRRRRFAGTTGIQVA
jgi:hypothetical protein